MTNFISASNQPVSYSGRFAIGSNWLGGSFFVLKRRSFMIYQPGTPLPYQAVVENANERVGLLLGGDDMVPGAYHS